MSDIASVLATQSAELIRQDAEITALRADVERLRKAPEQAAKWCDEQSAKAEIEARKFSFAGDMWLGKSAAYDAVADYLRALTQTENTP